MQMKYHQIDINNFHENSVRSLFVFIAFLYCLFVLFVSIGCLRVSLLFAEVSNGL